MRTPEAISSPLDPLAPVAPAVRFGFTLIELLAVVSIMALLSVLALPALNSVGSGNRLSASGRLVANLVSIARSEAINQRTLVQLRVLTTNQSGVDDPTVHYRKLSLWKFDQTQSPPKYVQFSNWETLPQGMMIEPGTNPLTGGTAAGTAAQPAYSSTTNPGTYFLNNTALINSDTAANITTGITYNTGVYHYAWVGFSPTGATTFPTGFSTVYLLLTEAFMPSSTSTVPTYAYQGTSHRITNWYAVTVNSLTGMSEVVQP